MPAPIYVTARHLYHHCEDVRGSTVTISSESVRTDNSRSRTTHAVSTGNSSRRRRDKRELEMIIHSKDIIRRFGYACISIYAIDRVFFLGALFVGGKAVSVEGKHWNLGFLEIFESATLNTSLVMPIVIRTRLCYTFRFVPSPGCLYTECHPLQRSSTCVAFCSPRRRAGWTRISMWFWSLNRPTPSKLTISL
ncbi:hypothetical protein BJ138DRAFT_797860 [Hygrophoropsis aurantiaca]|uniref:Uncharacterized protein n=1 Tax=Hygrophoropsis aurantiaca TaxID=72124 RepID=A0ACB7ZX58_9AGAM|nr:hypothetical protein BJ138DRAFT_797860 [Hygrophoropsis aurantiaca]